MCDFFQVPGGYYGFSSRVVLEITIIEPESMAGNYPGHGQFAFDGPYYREETLDVQSWNSIHTKNTYLVFKPGFYFAFLSYLWRT